MIQSEEKQNLKRRNYRNKKNKYNNVLLDQVLKEKKQTQEYPFDLIFHFQKKKKKKKKISVSIIVKMKIRKKIMRQKKNNLKKLF